jgi:thiamine kinase-like enzyme
MERDILSIVKNFRISGEIIGFNSDTTGHINDSYFIRISGDHSGYFLQWVNSYIFKDVASLMKNIETVTLHLAQKMNFLNRKENHKVLELIPALNGSAYYRDNSGEYWRMYRHIPGTHVYDIVENETIAYEGGKAFGRFISDLSDLEAAKLNETIPDFHNLVARLSNFNTSLNVDKVDRRKEIAEYISFINRRSEQMLKIPSLLKQGKLPMRITHNDTKFNNILFDQNNNAICIVDLDTVMPGSMLYDFGDAIRTGSNTVCEDEKDLSLVDVNLNIYKAYTRGFIKETLQSLTRDEIENLAFSARYMTFMIGVRFLTDYLDGDPYFRTNYPEHNLDRAKVQFKLLEAMEKKADEMDLIVRKACESCKSVIKITDKDYL